MPAGDPVGAYSPSFEEDQMPDVGTQACRHHWVLSAPDEDIVHGRCKRCGTTREYPASLDGASREGVYAEAASLKQSSSFLPHVGGGGNRAN